MGENFIDPLGVTAMATATLGVAKLLGDDAQALQATLDGVSSLVPGEPRIEAKAVAVAGNLSQVAGWAQQIADHFVRSQESLGQIKNLGYWLPDLPWDTHATASQNVQKLLTSDEFAAAPIGLATELLKRYRVLTYPGEGTPIPDIPLTELMPVDDVYKGIGYVKLPSGLEVPVGSSADPYTKVPDDIPVPDWLKDGMLGGDPESGGAPGWANVAGKGLFAVGGGLTLYGDFAGQWDDDQVEHPGWSTTHRVVSATTNTVVVGGSTVAGAYGGAELGAEGGAAVGTLICPGVGTVVGGVVGGVGGAFVGSKVGKAVGSGIKSVGSSIGSGAKKVWDSVF